MSDQGMPNNIRSIFGPDTPTPSAPPAVDLTNLPDREGPTLTDSSPLPPVPQLRDSWASLLSTAYRAQPFDPDQYAKAVDASRKTGLPVPTAYNMPKEAQQRAAEPDWHAVESAAPKFTGMIYRRPEMFQQAKDDTAPLMSLETTFRNVAQFAVNNSLPGLAYRYLTGKTLVAPAAGLGSGEQGVGTAASFALDPSSWFVLGLGSHLGAAALSTAAKALGKKELATSVTAAGLKEAGPLLTKLPGLSTRGAGALAAYTAVSNPLQQEIATGTVDPLAALGEVGKSAALGAILPVSHIIPGRGALPATARFLAETGLLSEGQAVLHGDLLPNADELLGSVGLVAGLRITGAIGHVIQAARAGRTQEALQTLNDQAAASKLRKRSPADFATLVNHLADGSDAENVYIDAGQFNQYFQDRGIDPVKIAADLGVSDQYDTAAQSGGDLRIPTGDLLAKFAGTEYGQDLIQHSRFAPGDISAAEATSRTANIEAQLQGEARAALNRHATNDYLSQSADRVYNDIKTQIEQTGRFTPDVADKYASLHRAFAVTMADRLGTMPADIYQQYGLKVTGGLRGQATYGQDQEQRGAIQIPDDFSSSPAVISILPHADLSTFLHESGHFFLEALTRTAAEADAPEAVKQDVQHLMDWFGVKDLATWQKMSVDARRPHHEKLARGFEQYLFEGKSPSPATQGLFATFRAWLVSVYRHLTALNVTLTPEVRQVFDRMLATDEQIQAQRDAAAYDPLFTDAAQAGMTPGEFANYQRQQREARDAAATQLDRASLRDMRWMARAKSQALKDLQRDAGRKRQAVEAEVTREVHADPVYAAQRFLSKGELPEDFTPSNQRQRRMLQAAGLQTKAKLSLPALKELYGDGPDALWRKLPVGRYGWVAENGVNPQLFAEVFGFGSADEMLRKMLDAEPMDSAIEGLTDRRMLERYGDITSPQTLERKAEEAISNEARARVLATELRALDKSLGKPAALMYAARSFAEKAIAGQKVNDAVKPAQYLEAERRAGRAALMALRKGDREGAIRWKRSQLLNSYLYRAASRAADEVQGTLRYLSRFDSAATRKALDPDYRDQIDALLERFDLRQSTTLRTIEKRKSLMQWVESQRDQGYDPAISAGLLNEAGRRSYKDITVEELRGVRNAVKSIEHIARLKTKLLTAKKDREIDAAIDDAVGSILGNTNKRRRPGLESRTTEGRLKQSAGEYFAAHRKISSLARQMDGFKDGGPVWEVLIRPANEKADAEAVARADAAEKLLALFDGYSRKERMEFTRKQFVPAINDSLTKQGRLMVALNWGNEGNRQRLMDGNHWTPSQVEAILETLDERDWGFVQGVWDLIDSFWPEIEAKQKRVTGVAPAKVEAAPVPTKFGTFRGGYFPLKYDETRSARVQQHDAAQVAKDMLRSSYLRGTTRRGHTEARQQDVHLPVRLDFGVIYEHLNQVIHDLAWHEYLIDAYRIVRSQRFTQAVMDTYGRDVYTQFTTALRDTAAGDLPAEGVINGTVKWIRSGASISAMGWNLMTAIFQPMGLSQSWVRIGPKWVAKGISRWLQGAAHMENTAGWIYEKSPFMRMRGRTMVREVREISSQIKPSLIPAGLRDSTFWLLTRAQLVADIPTWLGAYEKAMAEGNAEDRAVALADQAVIDSQSSGYIKDLARIQRGTEWQKLWTNFYSFFSAYWNLSAESFRQYEARGFDNPAAFGKFAADVVMLSAVPVLLTYLIQHTLRGDWDKQDAKKAASELAKAQASYMLGGLVGIRDLGSAIQGYDYKGPPGAALFSEASALSQSKSPETIARHANKAAGILFHYPATQIQHVVDGLQAYNEGRTQSPGSLLVGPPPKK